MSLPDTIAKHHVIADWLTSYLANLMEIPRASVGVDTPFEDIGIDSTAAACLSGDLAEWLDAELDAELAFRYRSVNAVAAHLALALHCTRLNALAAGPVALVAAA